MSGHRSASQIQALVDAKVAELNEMNDVSDILKSVFCLCSDCEDGPLLERVGMVHECTSYKHFQDLEQDPDRNFYCDTEFMQLYRGYLNGNNTISGDPTEQHSEPQSAPAPAVLCTAVQADSPSASAYMDIDGDQHLAEDNPEQQFAAGEYADMQSPVPAVQPPAKAASSQAAAAPAHPLRRPPIYTKAGFVGRWASWWAMVSPSTPPTRPSREELRGRLPGQDGSRCIYASFCEQTGDVASLLVNSSLYTFNSGICKGAREGGASFMMLCMQQGTSPPRMLSLSSSWPSLWN